MQILFVEVITNDEPDPGDSLVNAGNKLFGRLDLHIIGLDAINADVVILEFFGNRF